MVKLTPELLYNSIERLIECKEIINSYNEEISNDKEKYDKAVDEGPKIIELVNKHIEIQPVNLEDIIHYTRFIKQLYTS